MSERIGKVVMLPMMLIGVVAAAALAVAAVTVLIIKVVGR